VGEAWKSKELTVDDRRLTANGLWSVVGGQCEVGFS
jgi:hypothetical protein